MLQLHKPSIRDIGRFQMANSDVSTLGPGAAMLDEVKKHWVRWPRLFEQRSPVRYVKSLRAQGALDKGSAWEQT
jgi:hypothetical protein